MSGHSFVITLSVVWAAELICVAIMLFKHHITIGRRSRRRADGQCLACGYDLTGNVSGACPECGGKVG